MIITYAVSTETASEQPKISQCRPLWAYLDAFGAHFGPRRMIQPNGIRARTRFVAISSVRSDPWRSKRVSGMMYRYHSSDASSDDINVISRELSRPGHHLAPSARRQGAAERFRRPLWLRKCVPSACTPKPLWPTRWNRCKRSESTPLSDLAVFRNGRPRRSGHKTYRLCAHRFCRPEAGLPP